MKHALKSGFAFPFLILVLAALACNWSDIAPPSAPEIEPSPLPTFAISTLTPIPTETPLPTPTSTPDAPVAWPKNQGVNCRFGPGQGWEVVSTIPSGTTAEIKGRVVDTSWWYVRNPMKIEESFCWVAYDVMDTAGNLNIIPIVEPPSASVTDVTVDTVTVTFAACGGSNQVTLNGSLTANGPATVNYRWEVSGAAQQTTEERSLTFGLSEKNTVTAEILLPDCGDYTALLHVTAPNEISAQKTLSIQSP